MGSEEWYQVFVKLIDGKSKAINFERQSQISENSIKEQIFITTNIPISQQILIFNDLSAFHPKKHSFPVFCTLTSRLRAGKGGFGSLLRGAATKAGQKKTNNFDACRDMSGRRLRHVNAEKRLEEWTAEEKDRELEKKAEDFLKKKLKDEKKSKKDGGGAEMNKYLEKYQDDLEKCKEVVEKSVRESLGKKRKAVRGSKGDASKKLEIWKGKGKVDDSDSDDTSEDDIDDNEEQMNENSVVLDNENHSDSNKELQGSSDSITGGKVDGNSSAGGSSENGSDGDEKNVVGNSLLHGESSGEAMVEKIVQQNGGVSLLEETVVFQTQPVKTENVTLGQPPVTSSSGKEEALECGTIDVKTKSNSVPVSLVQEEIVAAVADPVKPLNFDEFNSSAELEALGMEKLKSELQSVGLKCGGTLQERAARLFLLKTTPLEKLPKKLLAKK